MREDVAMAWIEALRSGKYKQCRRELKDPHGNMCCLGVLCDISKLGKWRDAGVFGALNLYNGIDAMGERTFSSTGGTPPRVVQEWAGMTDPLGSFAGAYIYGGDSLAQLNDRGRTFEQIADILETHWVDL